MNNQINNEVSKVLDIVSGIQHDNYEESGRYFKIQGSTDISGLSYLSLNYFNNLQGHGYGIIFSLESGTGCYKRSIDIGFIDPPFIISGEHPVMNFDWIEEINVTGVPV